MDMVAVDAVPLSVAAWNASQLNVSSWTAAALAGCRAAFLSATAALLCVGLFGNAMATLLIQSKEALKGLASNALLCGLALLSSVYLTAELLSWAQALSGVLSFCQGVRFVGAVADFACVWVIVGTCLDRFLLLFFPEIRGSLCTIRGAVVWCLGAVAVGGCVHGGVLVARGEALNPRCEYPNPPTATPDALGWVEALLSFAVPALIVTLLNFAVIIRIRSFAAFGKAVGIRRAPSTETRRSRDLAVAAEETLMTVTTVTTASKASQHQTMSDITNSFRAGEGLTPREEIVEFISSMPATLRYTRRRSIHLEDVLLTKRLIILTLVFVFLNAPSYLLPFFVPPHAPSIANEILGYICSILFNAHHGCIFFVYIFNSPQMRKEIRPTALKVLECWCCKNDPDFGH